MAVVTDHGRFADSLLATSFCELLASLGFVAHVGVDIPIGPPEEGARPADDEAREAVGPFLRSTVFRTPPRRALEAPHYADARAAVPWLSAQSHALRAKILEVERCLEERVFEVHPEVSFAALAGRHLRHSKRTWNGQMERRRLLREAGLDLPDELVAGGAAADDVLDAAVAAWSAGRRARGEAKPLPADPPVQGDRAVAIWY